MSKLTKQQVQDLIFTQSIEHLSIDSLVHDMLADELISRFVPDSKCQLDPRDGELIVYNSSRAQRLHTVKSSQQETADPQEAENCPICQAKSTSIIDMADLSDGFTFINKNLYPIFYPAHQVEPEHVESPLYPDPLHTGRLSHGFHFLQWSSSEHHKDWHNMPTADCLVLMQRLALLEKKLLHESQQIMPPSDNTDTERKNYGYVSIIKNYGAAAGASLNHGHQQIGYSNIMPRRFYNNWCFEKRHAMTFNDYMLQENPQQLWVKAFGDVVLMVPYFMRRPYDMLLILKDTAKRNLHELDNQQLTDLTTGLQQAIQLIMQIMPQMGKTPSYNLTFNTGPGAGIYVEILPQIQLRGGFEQLGLWVCQAEPFQVAKELRALIATL